MPALKLALHNMDNYLFTIYCLPWPSPKVNRCRKKDVECGAMMTFAALEMFYSNNTYRTFEGLQTSSLACFQHLFFGSDLLSAGATVDSKINSEQVIVDSSYTNTQQRLNSHIWC